nr:sulfur carrier protein ThiS [Desulfobulbaceae bacterium]
MQIRINGEDEQLEKSGVSISELLIIKKVESPDMVSVQLNGEIIDRSQYQDQVVSDGDELDFLYFMGGGAFS